MIDHELLNILICPACKAKVVLAPDGSAILCTGCPRAYPVQDGIPIMLVDRATLRQ